MVYLGPVTRGTGEGGGHGDGGGHSDGGGHGEYFQSAPLTMLAL